MLSWTKYYHPFTHNNIVDGEEKSDGVERSVTIIPHPGGQESRCLSICGKAGAAALKDSQPYLTRGAPCIIIGGMKDNFVFDTFLRFFGWK